MQNTRKRKLDSSSFLRKQTALIESLKQQPLIIVIRLEKDFFNIPAKKQLLFANIKHLTEYGIKHIEIGWDSNIAWTELINEIQSYFKEISLGAASVNCEEALKSITELDLKYSMTPFFNKELQMQARNNNQLLVPGISNTKDFKEALKMGCEIIKIFPASELGIDFLKKIRSIYKENIFFIGAGGLQSKDIENLLISGYNAIALGRSLVNRRVDSNIQIWLKSIYR